MSNPFLDQIKYLTPEQRNLLLENGYDDADAFLGTTQEALTKIGILPGTAAKLMRLAGAVESAQQVGKEAAELLKQLGGPSHLAAVRKLQDLGVERCVVGADGQVDASTADYIAEGSPDVEWYRDGQVVRTSDVGAKRLHHPKTGAPLSRGDLIAWYSLSRDKLITAAAIFLSPDILAGEGDRAVFDDLQRDGLLSRSAATRLARDKGLRARAEAKVDGGSGGPGGSCGPVDPNVVRAKAMEAITRIVSGHDPEVLVDAIFSPPGRPGRVLLKITRGVDDARAVGETIIAIAQEHGLRASQDLYRGSGTCVTIKRS